MVHNSQVTHRQSEFIKNYEWQERYLDQVTHYLRGHVHNLTRYELATPIEDMQNGFDMTIRLTAPIVHIAVRLRRANVAFRDFTIRAEVPSGARTELQKIKEGTGHLYFYGWLNQSDNISEYILVNMAALRKSGLLDLSYPLIPNYDGTRFIAISIDALDKYGCLFYCGIGKYNP
jgi:hypothetical protein